MITSYQYRIFCETEGVYKYTLGLDGEMPTVCPDNVGPVVQSGTGTIVDTIEETYKNIPFNLISKGSVGTETSNTTYTPITRVRFPGTDDAGTPTKIKIIVRVEGSAQPQKL